MDMAMMLRLVLIALLGVATMASTGGTWMTRSLRGLETRLWDISEPSISHSGMQLSLDYTVRDHIQENKVVVELFRDLDCTREIPDETDYITTDIVPDLTTVGTGEDTRQMTIDLNFKPAIGTSRVATAGDGQTIVTFCARFGLKDGGEIQNSVDTILVVAVDLVDRIEITGLVENEVDKFTAEAFECDEDNQRIQQLSAKHQGDILRLCVEPNEFALSFGVAMKSINSFTLVRGDVVQEVVQTGGLVQDIAVTEYRCIQGRQTCTVDTIINNAFYYSNGEVTGNGVAWMQYGSRRLQVPITLGNLNQPQSKHRAQTGAGIIGEKEFQIKFQVEPAGTGWVGSGFLCDGKNQMLSEDAANQPRNVDDDIRVCFAPDQAALANGAYMRAISSFYFQQGDDNVQFAVEPTSKQAVDTIYLCNPGDPICALKTRLSPSFFEIDQPIIGRGELLLQYGTDPWDLDSQSAFADGSFAGASDLHVEIRVDPKYVSPSQMTWQEKAEEWWLDTPLFLRVVYILLLLFSLVVTCIFLWAVCCANPFRPRKATSAKATNGPDVVVQPVYVEERGEKEEDFETGKGQGVYDQPSPSDDFMDPVPETESTDFAAPPSPPDNDPQHGSPMNNHKSPGRRVSRQSVNSPKRQMSKDRQRPSRVQSDRTGMNAPATPKQRNKSFDPLRTASEHGTRRTSATTTPKSRRSTLAGNRQSSMGSLRGGSAQRRASTGMNTPRSATNTPKTRRSTLAGNRQSSMGSLRAGSAHRNRRASDMDDLSRSSVHSQSSRRSTLAGNRQSPVRSPKTGARSASVGMDGISASSVHTPSSRRSTLAGNRQSSVGSLKAGRRRSSVDEDDMSSSAHSRRSTLAGNRQSSVGSKKKKKRPSKSPKKKKSAVDKDGYPVPDAEDDGVRVSATKSPKPRRGKRMSGGTEENESPTPGRSPGAHKVSHKKATNSMSMPEVPVL